MREGKIGSFAWLCRQLALRFSLPARLCELSLGQPVAAEAVVQEDAQNPIHQTALAIEPFGDFSEVAKRRLAPSQPQLSHPKKDQAQRFGVGMPDLPRLIVRFLAHLACGFEIERLLV